MITWLIAVYYTYIRIVNFQECFNVDDLIDNTPSL